MQSGFVIRDLSQYDSAKGPMHSTWHIHPNKGPNYRLYMFAVICSHCLNYINASKPSVLVIV